SPFMPFITEEIWHAIYAGRPPAKSIALARYPQADQRWLNNEAEEQMATLQELIVNIRNLRAEMKVEPRVKVPARVFAGPGTRKLIEQNLGMIERLANVAAVEFAAGSLSQ